MSDEDGSDAAPKALIYEMRRQVQTARNQYWRQGAYGTCTDETHIRLAEVAVEYADVLHEYRDEMILDDGDMPDMDALRDRIGKKIERFEEAPGRTSALRSVSVPAVLEIPAEDIVQKTKELDDLAKKLGFSAAARNKTANTESTQDDLVHLLTARGQEKALENLPDSWLTEEADD